MFNLFSKNQNKDIEKSVKKYNDALKEDINLVIRLRHNGRLYTSYVENIGDKEVIFRCPTDEYEIIRFRENSSIKVELISYSGLYKTKLLIKEMIVRDDIVYYKGEIIESIDKNQRRQNYRLPIVLDLTFVSVKRDHIQYEGNTLDISVDGMLMETHEDMLVKKDIRINIEIDEKKYDIEGTLLSKRANHRNQTYLYNIKFKNLSSRHKKEISRYIYDNRNDIKSTL